ncbi:hypothetical protein RJT34_24378 [Clitoria ternatea]|uniref:Uncharacterized protein n=1 Tax=Clitoria ternatea TaxID=43366 RepID=A0AAN9FU04_CLITE
MFSGRNQILYIKDENEGSSDLCLVDELNNESTNGKRRLVGVEVVDGCGCSSNRKGRNHLEVRSTMATPMWSSTLKTFFW